MRVPLKLRDRVPLAVLTVVATVCVALAPTPAAAGNLLVKGVGSGRSLAPAATSGAAAVI